MLKSFQHLVVFWEGEEKRTEPKFRLLGLEHEDMQAMSEHISEADERILLAKNAVQNLTEAFAQITMGELRRLHEGDPEEFWRRVRE